MNIIFVANRYVPNGKATQGFTAYLNRITKALKQRGHNIVIVACGNSTKQYTNDDNIDIYIENVKYKSFEYKPFERVYNDYYMSFVVNKRIRKLCKEKQFDIIQFTSLSALSLLYYGRIPAIMRLSSYAKIAYQTHQTLDESDEKMISFLERKASMRCQGIFAPCKNTAVEFSKDIKRKVYIIESPFYNDVTECDQTIYQEKLRGKKYALFFGKLYVEKGIIEIAKILSTFLKCNSEYYFVFCGETSTVLGKDARKFIKECNEPFLDRIIFIDALSHENLYPIISHAQFVTLPSLMENLSNACIEAMAFGKLVIGTDGASFEQLINDGQNGLLCRIGDPKSLLLKMNQAAKMDINQKEVIEQNAIRRIELLKPEITVRKLEKFYKYIINKGVK